MIKDTNPVRVGTGPQNTGVCQACGYQFRYTLIHNGFNESAYGYCNSCGRTVILSGYSPMARQVSLAVHQPINSKIEALLKACPCGGSFAQCASPRCPSCNQELGADAAAEYIERDAPGAKRGWRWQRSWKGVYCILIEDRVLSDWWRDNEEIETAQES